MIWTSMLLGAALYLVGFALGTWLILTAWNASTALGVVALIVIGSMMLGGLATYVQRIAVALENRAMGRDWRSGLLGGDRAAQSRGTGSDSAPPEAHGFPAAGYGNL